MPLANPFPGMNPYLEASWPDVHLALLGFIREVISKVLPSDLYAAADEEGAVAEPEIIEVTERPHRWIEIREENGQLITVIEVLSPSNKTGTGRTRYLERQESLLHAGVNMVEIDLLRVGQPVLSDELRQCLKPPRGTRYLVLVSRFPNFNRREVYYCPLREPLPIVRVPLRRSDPDIALSLQTLIDRVYETGRYWRLLSAPLAPPPLPKDDAEWLADRIRESKRVG